MSTIQPPWSMLREKLSNDCPSTSTSPDQCDCKFCNASASEIAERFVDLSAFIYRGYGTGIIMLDLPILKSMKHLSNRLYAYAFALAIEKTPGFLTRPGQSTTLTTSTAVESMGQLATFLLKKADHLTVCGLSGDTEFALASDLCFARDYTAALLQNDFTGAPHMNLPPGSKAEVATGGNSTTEKAEGKSAKAQGKTRANESSHIPQVVPNGTTRDNPDTGNMKPSDSSAAPLQAPGCSNRTFKPAVDDQTTSIGSASQSSTRSGHTDRNLDDSAQTQSASTSRASSLAGLTTPHDLRPTPYNAGHAPHPLSGPRLHSKYGLDDNEAFAEVCSASGKVLTEVPNPCTTVQVGHSNTELFQPHHYAEISLLGLEGVEALKLVHPFCAWEIHRLDFDVLRYIDIVLCELASTRDAVTRIDNRERKRTTRRAEKHSMWLVEREIGIRAWEIVHRMPNEAVSESMAGVSSLLGAPSTCVPEAPYPGDFCTGAASQEQIIAQRLTESPQKSSPAPSRSQSSSRCNGSSAEQLSAQISTLRHQLATPQSRSSPRPGVRIYAPAQVDSMPPSPLQGPSSSLAGPHESCNCCADPAFSRTVSPTSVVDKVAEGAHENITPKRQTTGNTQAHSDDRSKSKRHFSHDETIASSSLSQTPALRTSRGRQRLENDCEDSPRPVQAGTSIRDRLTLEQQKKVQSPPVLSHDDLMRWRTAESLYGR